MFWKRLSTILGGVLIVAMSVRAQESTVAVAAGAAATNSVAAPAKKSGVKPQKSVKKTIEQAIKALEDYDCVTVAVDFLSPILRARIADIEAYRAQRQCSPQDKGNLDEVLLALKLARLGEPEYKGITATISLEGVGLQIDKFVFVKYLDGRWYFNEL